MRKDPRPVNDRDLFEDRNALTGDEPEGKLLGPIDTFRHRARYLALLLGFSEASRRYLARHPGLRWLRRAVYFVLVYLLLSAAIHTICQNISGQPLPSWASDGLSEAVLAALVALLAAQLIRCLCRRDMRWWERLLLFPVAALCTLLAAFFAAEAAPALKGFVQLLFA